ncbi:MAG: DUF3662 domain-containing protein [Actinobacteria bacterium]|nr:DUF3662 domain-containing protein [Actinomycetota bacterium]
MLTRTRRTGIRPIEIGRQIIAAMDDQAVTHNGDIAQRYVVGLHKSDLAALSDVVKPLLSELCQAIANHAKYEGYNIAGEADVALEEDVAQRIGSCVVTVGKTATTPHKPITQPEQLAVKPAAVVLVNGSRHTLDGDLVTIGRQASCTIVIADDNISRVHARFRAVDNGWTIEDLGSTNGTKVNGVLITEPTLLSHGQLIALGSLQLHFEQA